MGFVRLADVLGVKLGSAAERRRKKSVETPDGVSAPVVERSEVSAWCDEYMTRLALTTIKTRNKLSVEPSARTSGTDSAVLGALCSLMRLAKCGCFPAPERVLGERANKDAETVAKSLRRLAEQTYIIIHPVCEVGGATKYSIVMERLAPLPPKRERHLPLREQTELVSLQTGDLSHDAYHAKAIKPGPRIVYTYLLSHPALTRAEIARGMVKSKQTIGRAVKHLRALRMAEEDKDGRWRVSTRRVEQDEDLDEIAAQCHTTGRGQARQRVTAEARAAFWALKKGGVMRATSSDTDHAEGVALVL